MSKYDKMDKTELRAACKKAGFSYRALTVQGMRDALSALAAPAAAAPAESVPTAVTTTPAPAATPAAATAKATVRKQKKAATPVDEQNGVRKPREGGVCRQVWDWLDKNPNATSKDLRAWAEGGALNANNASIELSRWRKYRGLSRSSRIATDAAADQSTNCP